MPKKAMSLLEIIISMVILSLTLAGFTNIFFSGKTYLLSARSRMAGGEVGKYFLDPLAMQVRADQWQGGNCLGGGTCDNSSRIINNINYTPDYNITNLTANPNIRKVILTLNWTEPKN